MNIDNLTAKEIADKNYFSVSPDDSLKDVLGKIKKEEAFSAPVMKKKELKGMITWRRIIQRKVSPNTKVKRLMVHPPRIEHDTNIVDLAEKMLETGSRSVPVFEKDNVIGIISQKEFIDAVSKDGGLGDKKAKEVSTEVITINKDKTIGKARALMRENRISRLPVVDDDGMLVGSVDLSGILKTLKPEDAMKLGEKQGESVPERDTPVTGIMTRTPITLPRGSSMKEVLEKMTSQEGLYAVLEDSGKPIGMITPKDIIEMIASRKEEGGAYIQVAGIKDLDSFAKDKVLDAAERKVEKAGRMFRGVERLILHVKRQNVEGKKEQYCTRARMFTSDGMFVAKQDWEWEIMDSVQGCLEKLDKQITKYHEKQVERRRGRGKHSKG